MGHLVLYARCVHANLFTRMAASAMSMGLLFYGLTFVKPAQTLTAFGAVLFTIGFMGFVFAGCAVDTYVEYKRTRKSLCKARERGILSYHALQNHTQVAGIELAARDLGVTVWKAHIDHVRRNESGRVS